MAVTFPRALEAIFKRYDELSVEATRELIWLLSLQNDAKAIKAEGIEVDTLIGFIAAVELFKETKHVFYSTEDEKTQVYIQWHFKEKQVFVDRYWTWISEEGEKIRELDRYSWSLRAWLKSIS